MALGFTKGPRQDAVRDGNETQAERVLQPLFEPGTSRSLNLLRTSRACGPRGHGVKQTGFRAGAPVEAEHVRAGLLLL